MVAPATVNSANSVFVASNVPNNVVSDETVSAPFNVVKPLLTIKAANWVFAALNVPDTVVAPEPVLFNAALKVVAPFTVKAWSWVFEALNVPVMVVAPTPVLLRFALSVVEPFTVKAWSCVFVALNVPVSVVVPVTVNVESNSVDPETVNPTNEVFPAVKVPNITSPPSSVKSWLTTTLFKVVSPVTINPEKSEAPPENPNKDINFSLETQPLSESNIKLANGSSSFPTRIPVPSANNLVGVPLPRTISLSSTTIVPTSIEAESPLIVKLPSIWVLPSLST